MQGSCRDKMHVTSLNTTNDKTLNAIDLYIYIYTAMTIVTRSKKLLKYGVKITFVTLTDKKQKPDSQFFLIFFL